MLTEELDKTDDSPKESDKTLEEERFRELELENVRLSGEVNDLSRIISKKE